MNSQRTELPAMQESRLPIRAKLAAAWTSFMFLYIYVDYLHLYKPGVVQDILNGVVWEFDISQTFAFTALASMAIPILMIWLSATLPARASRIANLVVASLYIPYSAFNLAGGEWIYYYSLGLALEVVILGYIIRSARAWPRTAPTYLPASAPHPSQIRAGR